MAMSPKERAKAGWFTSKKLQQNPGVVPYGWLVQQTTHQPCFKNAKNGPVTAFNRSLQDLESCGDIREIKKPEHLAEFDARGRLFACVGLEEKEEE